VIDFLVNYRIVDLILIWTVIEAGLLVVYFNKTGRGVPPISLLANLAAGGFLMLALRGVLVSAQWPWIAAAFLGSFIAHLLDLRLRWRS
jgi:hypothetical protein